MALNLARELRCARVDKVLTACDAMDIPPLLEPVIIGAAQTEEVIAEEQVACGAYDSGVDTIEIAFLS